MVNIDRVMSAVKDTSSINAKANKSKHDGYFIDKDEYFIGCGFYGVCLNSHLDGVKETKYPIKEIVTRIREARLTLRKYPGRLVELENMPTFDDLDKLRKTYLREKTQDFVIYREGIGNHMNGFYLYNMYCLLGNCICYYLKSIEKFKPFYFIGENGDGILMPILSKK